MDPSDDSYWMPPVKIDADKDNPEPPPPGSEDPECQYCASYDKKDSSQLPSPEPEFVTYLREKQHGRPCGPWFVDGWPRHDDPRFCDEESPLYDINSDPESDWRAKLNFQHFADFLTYVERKFGKKKAPVPKELSDLNHTVREMVKEGRSEEAIRRRLSEILSDDGGAKTDTQKLFSSSLGNGNKQNKKKNKRKQKHGDQENSPASGTGRAALTAKQKKELTGMAKVSVFS